MINEIGSELSVRHATRLKAATRRSWFQRIAALIVLLPVMSIELFAAQSLNRNPGWPGVTLSDVPCYGEGNETRFDYISERNRVGIVEKYHFHREIQQLAVHHSRLDGDLDYTLRSIPNHHHALWVRSKFYMQLLEDDAKREELQRNERLREGHPPPECYFNRGKAFNPLDGMVPAVFGIYLHKRGEHEAALTEYKLAEQLLPKHSEVTYNMGLLYFDMGRLDMAREYAERARDLGYPLKGLQRKLEAAEAEGEAKESVSATD